MINVMIVDDDKDIVDLLKRMIEYNGYTVMGMAYNGKEAVDLYKTSSKKPDIILMDYKMPLMDGIIATKEILEFDKSAKILFLSGDNTIKNCAIESGAFDFCNKPLDFKLVFEILKKISNDKNNHVKQIIS